MKEGTFGPAMRCDEQCCSSAEGSHTPQKRDRSHAVKESIVICPPSWFVGAENPGSVMGESMKEQLVHAAGILRRVGVDAGQDNEGT
jgi:hypothetical protein